LLIKFEENKIVWDEKTTKTLGTIPKGVIIMTPTEFSIKTAFINFSN